MEDFTGKNVVIISDTHLGRHFKQKKYNKLVEIISACDQLIINGDFWEGYELTLNEFLLTKWQKLFPLLLSKNTIYLYGNHDKEQEEIQKYEIFCKKSTKEFEFAQDGTIFHVTHGDTLAENPVTPDFLMLIGTKTEEFLIQLFGDGFLRPHHRKYNNHIKGWKIKNLPEKDWLICSHTHLGVIDWKTCYANTGSMVVLRVASYLIIVDGKPLLKFV